MHVVGRVLYDALTLFWVLLIIRLVMSYVFLFARNYRASGAVAILLEIVYSATDPPIKALRRFIPPLRLGNVSLDLSVLVLFIIVAILRYEAQQL